MQKSRVALVKGDERYSNIARALEAIKEDIDLAGKRRIVIKPNFVSTRRQVSATHVDAVRAVLDFLRARGVEEITLAESPSSGTFSEGLEAYGYGPLIDEYRPRVIDLGRDDNIEVEGYDRDLRPLSLRMARTMVESDYLISVGPPKTHDTVNVTLSLKNVIVGALSPPGQRRRFHQGYQAVNLTLFKLAAHVTPDLAIIDGFQAMEGNGPVSGDPVDWKVAIASTDFLAADSLALRLMGFSLEDIGYLYYCQIKGLGQGGRGGHGRRSGTAELVGNATITEVQRTFKPHTSYQRQLEWKIPGVERYL